MTEQPQHGDRVRITFDATWWQGRSGTRAARTTRRGDEDWLTLVPDNAHVEVLPSGPEATEATEPEPSDPTECSGEAGACPEHGHHKDSLKQPGEAAESPLRDQIAEALLDHLSRTADIRPSRSGELAFMPEVTDVERLRIADAVLSVVLPHGRFLGDQLRDSEARLTETREALYDVLRHFVHKGHPGEPCLSSGWISERTVARWRAVLYPPADHTTEN